MLSFFGGSAVGELLFAPPPLVVLGSCVEYPSGIATNDGAVSDIFCHDRSCGDNAVRADLYARHDDRPHTDEDIVAYIDPTELVNPLALPTIEHRERAVVGEEDHIVRDPDITAEADEAGLLIELCGKVDVAVITHCVEITIFLKIVRPAMTIAVALFLDEFPDFANDLENHFVFLLALQL